MDTQERRHGFAKRLDYAAGIACDKDLVDLADINAVLDERHALVTVLRQICGGRPGWRAAAADALYAVVNVEELPDRD